jgi:hypothetical protein
MRFHASGFAPSCIGFDFAVHVIPGPSVNGDPRDFAGSGKAGKSGFMGYAGGDWRGEEPLLAKNGIIQYL